MGSLNVNVINMRSLNQRLLNPGLLNSCFTAGQLAPIKNMFFLFSFLIVLTKNITFAEIFIRKTDSGISQGFFLKIAYFERYDKQMFFKHIVSSLSLVFLDHAKTQKVENINFFFK